MERFDLIMLIGFLIFEGLTAFGVPSGKYSYVGAGLLCYAATLLF